MFFSILRALVASLLSVGKPEQLRDAGFGVEGSEARGADANQRV